MKTHKQSVQWFKQMLSRLNDGGLWGYEAGNSVWIKQNDNTVEFAVGEKSSNNNIQAAAHIRAAGFSLIGI